MKNKTALRGAALLLVAILALVGCNPRISTTWEDGGFNLSVAKCNTFSMTHSDGTMLLATNSTDSTVLAEIRENPLFYKRESGSTGDNMFLVYEETVTAKDPSWTLQSGFDTNQKYTNSTFRTQEIGDKNYNLFSLFEPLYSGTSVIINKPWETEAKNKNETRYITGSWSHSTTSTPTKVFTLVATKPYPEGIGNLELRQDGIPTANEPINYETFHKVGENIETGNSNKITDVALTSIGEDLYAAWVLDGTVTLAKGNSTDGIAKATKQEFATAKKEYGAISLQANEESLFLSILRETTVTLYKIDPTNFEKEELVSFSGSKKVKLATNEAGVVLAIQNTDDILTLYSGATFLDAKALPKVSDFDLCFSKNKIYVAIATEEEGKTALSISHAKVY